MYLLYTFEVNKHIISIFAVNVLNMYIQLHYHHYSYVVGDMSFMEDINNEIFGFAEFLPLQTLY